MAWIKDKFNYKAQEIRELNVVYMKIAQIKEKTYINLSVEEKIDILLAKRNVCIFLKDIVEQTLSHRVIGGKVKKRKMGTAKKLIIEDYVYHFKNIILDFEDKIYKTLNIIPISTRKDKIRAKLTEAKIYEQPYGCEHFDMNFTDKIRAKNDPFELIMCNVILRDILAVEFTSIQKHLTKLHQTPRTNDIEKAYFVHFLHELRKEYTKKDKLVCELYFKCLPTDDPNRAAVRKKILNYSVLFKPFIYSMLYDMEDHRTIWWNFQELISPDRELQLIAKELVDYAHKTKGVHNRAVDFTKSKTTIYFHLLIHEIADIDITEFIKTSPALKHANDRINDIPSLAFAERKELFEEIIKTKCWEYIQNNFRFPLAVWANATTFNYGDSM